MTEVWQDDYEVWNKRSLLSKKPAAASAGLRMGNCRLSDDRPCVLVLVGATATGEKELIAMVDGQRESEASWTSLLLDLKRVGMCEQGEVTMRLARLRHLLRSTIGVGSTYRPVA